MQSSSQSNSSGDEQGLLNLKINPEVLLGLATLPVLVGLVGVNAIAQSVQELGMLSEEIFRGDRLPVLNLSDSSDKPS
ncbi:hypothetical protein ACKFKG_30690 [Phormidesmis sp. 146-35]